MNEWTDEWTDGWMNEWMDAQQLLQQQHQQLLPCWSAQTTAYLVGCQVAVNNTLLVLLAHAFVQQRV